tara:strand:+ start:1044 stop:1229 length:186 start_codon:yes stop_codon:yes gene_type:complete
MNKNYLVTLLQMAFYVKFRKVLHYWLKEFISLFSLKQLLKQQQQMNLREGLEQEYKKELRI